MQVPAVRYARAGDASIAYQVFGEGPRDLVVTPGFVSHLDLQWTMPSYTRLFEMLASFARVIIFDKRGTGLSDPTAGSVRFDQRADDIRAVMDAAGSERAVLMGMSEGGPLSILFAANHPDRVESLILYGTFARGAQLGGALIGRFEDAIEHWGSGLTAGIFASSEAESGMRRRLAAIFERASASPGMARALIDSVRTADVTALLPTLALPCLVLHRRDDAFAPLDWGEELAARIPGARLVVTEGSDHLPWFGDFWPLVEAITGFVGANDIPSQSSRRLASIMFTDIVNSTAMAVDLGDTTWSHLLRQHNLVMRDLLDEYRGEEVKSTGDGFLALFDSSARAVECGQTVVRHMADLGLLIRAGIHTGEVEIMGDDVAGVAVHIAARIAALADSGEVLVSTSVKDYAIGSHLAFADRGDHQLKGMPGSWHLFAAREPEDGIVIDLRQPRELNTTDHISLFLARRAPAALRALAGLTAKSA
jgi:class 3 adenylate cyclase/alpha-beta hydrolase superfamily lysophospholipase